MQLDHQAQWLNMTNVAALLYAPAAFAKNWMQCTLHLLHTFVWMLHDHCYCVAPRSLLDFEFCAYDWRIMELAVALSKVCRFQ